MKWQNLPPYIIYPMLIPHVFKLCIKYKSFLSIIVNANPILPYGGLPFASKKVIFDNFSKNNSFLRYKLIKNNLSYNKKINESLNFINEMGYPIIIKPDSSHRGIDVNLVQNEEELKKILYNQKWDYLLQEYCDYNLEFGVFYCRIPKDKKGSIISLSSKEIPFIFGDGVKNIRELILESSIDNKNAILNKYSKMLQKIPRKDEVIKTLICASHAQGAIFKDEKENISNDLIKSVDLICNIEGFYFGRLDVKAKNLDALKRGEFKIIEINGATSEFIHIYDKKYSLKQGLYELKEQWNILFKISSLNLEKSKNLSPYTFLLEYIRFFLLTKKVTGKLW